MSTTYPRRHFLKTTAAAGAGGAVLAGPFQGLTASAAGAAAGRSGGAGSSGGFGHLVLTPDQTTGLNLLALPEGFTYHSFGWVGETMSDGFATPDRHDGMAVFPGAGVHAGQLVLVRNHERGYDPMGVGDDLIGHADKAYDRSAGGGCTYLVWDPSTTSVTEAKIAINGTAVNCAGGAIGGSWFTCEETTDGLGEGFGRKHGYVFEVPAGTVVDTPVPITGMGRFRHEAVSRDDQTGAYFLTEDSGSTSGFYRFTPTDPADLLAGGTLAMLAVKGRPQTDLGTSHPVGKSFPVQWMTIDEPDPDSSSSEAVFSQGFAAGGAKMARLEGLWYGGGVHYFTATSGGDAALGQVWAYDDRKQQLTLVYESSSAGDLDSPDNITVTPWGGLLLCEDGDDDQYLRGLSTKGEIFSFARNELVLTGQGPGSAAAGDYRDKEFAGACFSPDGRWLFVNIQTPGVTFAITGPWSELR